MSTCVPVALAMFLREVWSEKGEADVPLGIQAVSANAEMSMLAIAYAVQRASRDVDRHTRDIAMGGAPQRAATKSHAFKLAKELVDHGLSLMDVRFGRKKLGDYTPSEADDYADTVKAAGRTMLV